MAQQVQSPRRNQGAALGTVSSLLSMISSAKGLMGQKGQGIDKKDDQDNSSVSPSTSQNRGEMIARVSNTGGAISNLTQNPALKKVAAVGTIAGGAYTVNPSLIAAGSAALASQQMNKEITNPIERRLSTTQQVPNDTMSKIEALRNAEIALNQMSPEYRREYGPPLYQTMLKASQQYRETGRIG
jgi:hypothetical protein